MSGRFFFLLFLNVVITMIVMVIVKRVAAKYNVPFLNAVASEV